jgi:hypothetical protein
MSNSGKRKIEKFIRAGWEPHKRLAGKGGKKFGGRDE